MLLNNEDTYKFSTFIKKGIKSLYNSKLTNKNRTIIVYKLQTKKSNATRNLHRKFFPHIFLADSLELNDKIVFMHIIYPK